MLHAQLIRESSATEEGRGTIFIGGKAECATMESKTRLPAGTYGLALESAPGTGVVALIVSGFSGGRGWRVRVVSASLETAAEGCIWVGHGLSDKESDAALASLIEKVGRARSLGSPTTIEVVGEPEVGKDPTAKSSKKRSVPQIEGDGSAGYD